MTTVFMDVKYMSDFELWNKLMEAEELVGKLASEHRRRGLDRKPLCQWSSNKIVGEAVSERMKECQKESTTKTLRQAGAGGLPENSSRGQGAEF